MNMVIQPPYKEVSENAIRMNMFLMLAGKLVSLIGSYIYSFAVGLFVLKLTGSGMSFAAMLIFSVLPRVIIGPFAGVVADRFDRKRMVVMMDFFSGIVVLLLFWLTTSKGIHLSYIYLTGALLSTFNTFFNVTVDASLPNLVDDKRLIRLNSLNQGMDSLGEIVGPLLGGVIFALIDIKMFFLINGISFILSAISELFIDFELTATREEKMLKQETTSLKKVIMDLKEGIAYTKTDGFLMTLFSFSLMTNFFMNLGYVVPISYIVNNVFQMKSSWYGIISGAYPVGIFIGSLLISVLPEVQKKYKMIIGCLATVACTLIMIGVLASSYFQFLNQGIIFALYTIIIFIMGVSTIMVNIPIFVVLQRKIPDSFRGRVFGLLRTTVMAMIPFSFLLAGLLIEKIMPFILPIAGGVGFLVIVLFAAKNKHVKAM